MRQRRNEVANTVEDETLNEIAIQAEVRLQQKRAARIEARKLRMQELIKKQCENEGGSNLGIKLDEKISRSSSPKTLTAGLSGISTTDFDISALNQNAQAVFADLQEKYRQAMVHSAQLENERSQLHYHCQLLKDILEEQEDNYFRLLTEHKTISQELLRCKHSFSVLEKKCSDLQEGIQYRDQLIKDQGFAVNNENGGSSVDAVDGALKMNGISDEARVAFDNSAVVGNDDSDSRVERLVKENQSLIEQVHSLKRELESEKTKENVNGYDRENEGITLDSQLLDIQRETNKQISEYKLKVQKLAQDNESLQSQVSRLETHLNRLRQATDTFEKNEDEMRAEKRKLSRDLRAALDRIEELQSANLYLERRLERLKASRGIISQT